MKPLKEKAKHMTRTCVAATTWWELPADGIRGITNGESRNTQCQVSEQQAEMEM